MLCFNLNDNIVTSIDDDTGAVISCSCGQAGCEHAETAREKWESGADLRWLIENRQKQLSSPGLPELAGR